MITAIAAIRELGIDFVRRYHRLEISGELAAPDKPVLFVANHGFGGIFDLNVFTGFARLAMDAGVDIVPIGGAGVLPYLPLPSKLSTAILPPMRPEPDEDTGNFAARVQIAMQRSLSELASRRPWR